MTPPLTKPAYSLHDNLDDRREIHRLLTYLPPRRRVEFLAWCCRRSVVPNSATRPGPTRKTWELAETARWDSSADRRLALDVYFDCWILCVQYELNLDLALERLVQLARYPAW